MSQDWWVDVYQATGKSADTVMGQIELMLDAVRSCFSGTGAPSSQVGGQLWHDSTARKVRNYANSAWLVSLLGDASQKMWVYRNDTCEGWIVDSSVADVCLCIKGGSNAYNVSGGSQAGTWSQPGHTHTTGDFTLQVTHIPPHSHSYTHWDWDGNGAYQMSLGAELGFNAATTGSTGSGQAHNHGSTASSAAASTYRPRAAVGTLQYPDLS